MRFQLASVAAALLLSTTMGHATVLPYKSLKDLVHEADGVVIGTVRSVTPTGGSGQAIHTFVTLDQIEVMSGKLDAQTLTLRLKGGAVGQEVLHVEGSPTFVPNERLLLFVQGNGRDLVPFVGWSQGVFRLTADGVGSGQGVVKDADGNDVVGLDGDQVLLQPGAHSGAVIAGGPAISQARSAPPQASAGTTDDGSASTQISVRRKAAAPMAAEAFLAQVRQRASTEPGRALRSVSLAETMTPDTARPDAVAAASRPARQPVAMPSAGAVLAPLPQAATETSDR